LAYQVRRHQAEGASLSSIALAAAASLALHEPEVVVMDNLQVRENEGAEGS